MRTICIALCFLAVVTYQANLCQVKIATFNIYPTSTEILNIDLSNFFAGSNLTFSQVGADSTSSVDAYGYIGAVDEGSSLPNDFQFQGAEIKLHQQTELWNGEVAVIGLVGTTTIVYWAELGYLASPIFSQQGVPLLTGQYKASFLPGLTYVSSDVVLVDSYYSPIIGGDMVNEWQMVSTSGLQTLPLVIPSSNLQSTNTGLQGFGRISQFWTSPYTNNGFLFRGTLNNVGGDSYLEMFEMVDNIPNVEPRFTISNKNFTGLQMTDFYVNEDGEIWILNSTNLIGQFLINELDDKEILIIPVGEFPLTPNTEYLSLDFEVDYRIPKDNTYSLILSTTAATNNIEDYLILDNKEPFLVGYYTVPVKMIYTGQPPQIDINDEYVSVQYSGMDDNQVYVFARGIPSLTPGTQHQLFSQSSILVSQWAFWAALNDMPSAMLSFTQDSSQIAMVLQPHLKGKFGGASTSGSIMVQAQGMTGKHSDSNCFCDLAYTELPSSDTTIQYTNPAVVYQLESFFPINTTLDFSNYISGPAIDISGTTIIVTEVITEGLTAYKTESTIVPSTILPLQISAPAGYPNGSTTFVENAFNDNDNSFIQFIQSEQELRVFICYQDTYDVAKVCYFVGQMITHSTIEKVETLFPISAVPYAYFFTQTGISIYSIQSFTIDWDKTTKTGSINEGKDIECVYMDLPIEVTNFAMVDQQLYVTLNQISQVWEYQIYTLSNKLHATKSVVISNDLLGLTEGFSPLEVVGNYDLFGPVIFVNNQLEFVIISILNNKVRLVSATRFPLTAPGLSSSIKIAGDQLVVVQTGSQTLISQFSLSNLYTPVQWKTLPLYNKVLKVPLEIDADGFFFYAVLNDNSLNIYKPASPSHESLFQQIPNIDAKQTFLFSATNDGTYSYITIVNSTVVITKRVQQHVTAVFVPGSYHNQYFTNVQFNLVASNTMSGSTPLSTSHTVQVFNSQIQVEFNDTLYNASNGGFIFQGSGAKNYTIDTSLYISGSVADYTIECDLCSKGNITIQNILSPWKNELQISVASGLGAEIVANVNAMALSPDALNNILVQTNSAIYNVDANLKVTLKVGFPSTYYSCNALATSTDYLFTLCMQNRKNSVDSIVLVNSQNSPTLKSFIVTETVNPQFAQSLSNTLFVLGTQSEFSTEQTIQIYTFVPGTQATLTYLKKFTCSTGGNNGVNDMALSMLNTYTVDAVAYAQYVLFYTCKQAKETPYFVNVLVNNSTGEVQVGEALPLLDFTINNLQLLVDTYFYQIEPISYDGTGNIAIVLQTSNIMNFVLQIKFNVLVKATVITPTPVTTFTVVTTLPPYAKWNAFNALTQSNGLLLLPYTLESDNLSFVAVFDLSGLDFTKSYPTPLLMLGGFYAPYATNLIYQMPRSVPNKRPMVQILTASSSGSTPYNLSTILLVDKVSVNVNVDSAFPTQVIKITAENYYVSQSFNTELKWTGTSSASSGVAWWGWLLIVIGILAVIGLGGFFYVYQKNKRTSDSPLLIQ